jgi:hypothetical protein
MNQGNGPADGVTAVEMSSGGTIVIGSLEAGQKMDLQLPAGSTAGPYLINVDPQNLIPESNETNNNLSYLLPTPTPYIGCIATMTADAIFTPPPPLPTLSPLITEGLIYADMNLAQINRVVNGWQSVKLMDGFNAQFSPNLEFAVFEKAQDLWLIDTQLGSITNLTKTADYIEINPQWWQANPSKIVFNVFGINEAQEKSWTQTMSGYVGMINTDGTEHTRLTEAPSFGHFALSPDGVTIAFDIRGFPNFYVIGLGPRSFPFSDYGSRATPAKGLYFFSPSFSPDGRQLSWWVANDESRMDRMFALELFDIAGRTSKVVHSYSALGGTLGWLESPIWSPNGQWIAFQTRGETTPRDLWVVNSDGNIGQRFGLATNPVWNPDSQHLAYVQWPPQSDSYLASSISFIEAPSWRIISSDLQAGGVPLAWTVTLPMP